MGVDRWSNVYMAANSFEPGSRGILVDKYDGVGRLQWSRFYSVGAEPCYAREAAVDSSGNVYLTGQCAVYQADTWYYPCATWKYSASGQLDWVAMFRRPGSWQVDAVGRDVAFDLYGNVFVVGWAGDSLNPSILTTLKYSASGSLLWEETLTCGGSYARVAVDRQGNAYVTPGSAGSGLWRILKYGSGGGLEWVATHGPQSSSGVFDIATDGDGNVLATGICDCQGSGYDICTAKYRPDGAEM
jgi:hypothetical protein